MKRTLVKDLKRGAVLIKGFVHELRDLGKIKFVLLRDWSGIVQCIIKDKKLFKEFSKLTFESVVEIRGKIKKAQIEYKDALHNIEIEVQNIRVLDKAEKLPIQILEKTIKTSLSKRLDFRSLDLRKLKIKSIFKIQSILVEAMQQWLNENNFLQVFTPCLIGSSSESGAETFSVNYYDKKVYLRQDPQLHRQLTILGGFEKIYDLGPNWRAELSHTTKHLSEHRCIAVEIGFIEDEKDIMKIQENLIIEAIKNVLKKCKDELKILNVELKTPKPNFPELKFPEIYKILEKNGKKLKKNEDLDSEAEKILADYVKKKFDRDFFFINGFPFSIKPFYVYHDSEYARSVDLYCKNLELSSGGQREHRYDILIKNIKEKNLNLKSLEWFTKFFKFGAPTHGGFAIGIERLTQVLLNLKNIREAVLFPRDVERIEP